MTALSTGVASLAQLKVQDFKEQRQHECEARNARSEQPWIVQTHIIARTSLALNQHQKHSEWRK